MQREPNHLSRDVYYMSKSLVDEATKSGEVLMNIDGVNSLVHLLERCFQMAVDADTRNQNNENYMENADLENVAVMADYTGTNVVPLFNDGGDAA